MLKKFLLNGKRIPVPIPVKTLPDAIAWIEKHLLRPDCSITRIELDGQDLDTQVDQNGRLPAFVLNEQSDLRVQMDSPLEICLQTIDALRNLSSVIGRNMKPVAVQLWEHKGPKLPVEAKSIFEDLQLTLELFDHVLVLVDKRVELSQAFGLQQQIIKGVAALGLARQHADWRGVARVLLNQIETPVVDLAAELTSLEKSVFEIQADRNLERRAQLQGR